MSSWPPNQQNNGRQMAPLQPTQIRPFEGSGREDLVSKLEALALNHTNPAARVFEPSMTTRTPYAHPLLQRQQPMYHQPQQQQQQHAQPLGPIGQPNVPIHPPQQPVTTSAAPLYASVASSSHYSPAASFSQYALAPSSSSHYAAAASTSQFIPTAASSAAAANAAAAAAAAASYQRRHIIKCGRCFGEMKSSISFHGWLSHCAHGRSFAPRELDYQVCGCNLAFMTAYEMETHLRSHGCDQRR